MTEKRRHFRPKTERNDRKCFMYKNAIEDELHYITNCPLYRDERLQLYNILNDNSTDEQIVSFIMTNENEKVTIELVKFIFNAMKMKQTTMLQAK